MGAEIATNVPLDCVKFQILQENRFNAFICSNENEEMVGHGLLDQLLDHLPNIKDQLANEPCDNFKLELPNNVDKRAWFTKAKLMRFLHIVGSPDLEKCVSITNEMSQLEETRKFHLSLYAKAEDGIASSDNSKNELVRAMDSRIAALMEELVSAFSSAIGGTLSSQEMMDLQEFCQHFGDVDISNLLSKLSEASQKDQIVSPSNNKKSPIPLWKQDDYTNKTGGNNHISGSNSDEDVKNNAFPTKVADLERQSSSESEESSFSSEDEQPSVERTRTFIRSASPRRSASPMRRIQVGKSGPRRTPALTIKSLTCFPARKPEGTEELDKKTEVNVTRISVQDAISLFESKQKDQKVDTENKKSFGDNSTNTKKSVLRRWSSGMGDSQKSITQSPSELIASEDKDNSELVDEDVLRSEVKPDKVSECEDHHIVLETVKVDMESGMNEKTVNLNEDNVPGSEAETPCENLDSGDWNRQKEEELSYMLMKFEENNQTHQKNAELDSSKNRNSRLEHRNKAYGHYKERKEEKRKEDNAGKRVQKPEMFRPKQKIEEKPKAVKSSVKVNDGGKKQTTNRTQNVKMNSLVSSNSKEESPNTNEAKRVSFKKSSALPTTRKSWSSTPSPRVVGTLPEKTSARRISSGTKAPPQKSQSPAPRQKPQALGPISQPSPRVERSEIKQKDVKKPEFDTKKSSKTLDEGKNRVVSKSGKSMKMNTLGAVEVETKSGKTTKTRTVATKEGKRVAKKSNVVPLEAKPSPRKVSGINHVSIPSIQKEESPAMVEETLSKCEDPINTQGNSRVTMSEKTVHLVECNPLSETHNGHLELVQEIDTGKHKTESKKEVPDEIPVRGDEIDERMPEFPPKIHPVEEPVISPAACKETSHQDPSLPSGNSSIRSPANHDTVSSSEPRVRHSLSHMLLRESCEPDIIEWGNAEVPSTMVYQKDARKGLKRLLKFAQKNNKGETNGVALTRPYTSEGEEDGDECRTFGKRNSDNLMRKSSLHSKNYAEGLFSDSEPLAAQSNASSSARSSNRFQEGHGTLKGTRSFFSLSAFRGSKS